VALEHRLEAQSKKKMKNKARLPRTAGLRTITDLTTDLTKAGLDPSRVQERATMIAKMRGASARKRRHGEDEDGMDVDGDDDDDEVVPEEGEGADAMMDVDGEWEDDDDDDDTPRKRGKANSGAAIARKRGPRSNRQLAGMRDEAVRSRSCPLQNIY
jgi:nucleolar GTP-binding protein